MILDRFRLDGKVALISGAGRGIGAGIARAFAEVGADVVIGARTESQLAEVAKDVAAQGRRAEVVTADLSEREGMQALVGRAGDAFGRIDIVVNNAGGSPPGPFLDLSEKAFNGTFQWNVTTAFNLTQLAVPLMLKDGGGNIINIASAAGQFHDRGLVAYGTAKAALEHAVRQLASELGSADVRVNAISAGPVSTVSARGVHGFTDILQVYRKRSPLGRNITADEVGKTALFLLSDLASGVTGEILHVDGGYNIMGL